MKFVGTTETTWNENCRHCYHANKRVVQEPGDQIFADPEQVLDFFRKNDRSVPQGFEEWSRNPITTGELWYCPYCELLWDNNNRWGINITCVWNGEIHQSSEIINMPSNPVTIPPRPTPYHQLCTQCNIWREIVSVDVIYVDNIRKVARAQRCSKCYNMNVFTSDEPEGEIAELLRQESDKVSRDMIMGSMINMGGEMP